MTKVDVLIVGGGHGGAQTAIALRQHKFEGSITIVSDETDFPYERPPLSKEYLSGDKPFERIMFRPESFWSDRGIQLRLGQRVEKIDPAASTVVLQSGEALSYGQLIWAAVECHDD